MSRTSELTVILVPIAAFSLWLGACEPDVATDDFDGDGTVDDQDCEPEDPAINPGVDETCDDGIDNDCDGKPDGMDDECTDPCASQQLDEIAGVAVAVGCDGLSFEGCCGGELLYWCDSDHVCLMDCDAVGVHCGWKGDVGIYDCKTSGVGAPDDDPPMECPADYPAP